MRMLCYMLMPVGLVLALIGVVAVFNFDQPSEMFSVAWWMIVGGWTLVLVGMGIDMLQSLTATMRKPFYAFQPELPNVNRVEEEVSRVHGV